MSSCPIKTDPDWIALVNTYGPADAMTAYINNNYSTPNLAEAEELFKRIRVVKDKDEQLSSSSDEFKLRKAVEQRRLLENASFTANLAQKETLDKIIAMNLAHQEFLRNNIEIINDTKTSRSPEKTTSVSKFIGSSEFKGDPKEYEAFKLFGTFIHDLLEVAQVAALEGNTSISKIYNQEFFDKAYERYIEKNPFTIENLSREELYDMAFGLVQNVNEKNKSGFIILPEITVVGKTATGTTIVGRLDLLLIDSQGRVHIYDFKTKKMSYLVQYNSTTNSNEVDVDRGLYELSLKETGISNQSGTGTSFRQVSTRTTYDTWMLQLDVYENMLMQNGINVRNKNIASLLYHIDRNDKSYKGSVLYVFDDEDYYGVVRNTNINTDGQFYNDVDSTNEHVLKLKRAVNIEIPVEGKTVNDDAVNSKSIDEVYDVTPTEKNIKDFIDSIEKLIDGQVQKLTEDIENAKSKPEIQRNKDYEKILTTRRDSIKNFKSIVDKLKSANPSDILYATNFFNALSIVEDDLNVLMEVSSIGADIYNEQSTSSVDKAKALNQVTEAFNKVILFKQVLDILENIVDEASQIENSKITADSPVRMKLSDLRLSANIITANFKDKVAMNNAIEILKSPGETVYQKVSEQQIAALIPQLEFIKKQIEDLKSNPKLGLYSRIKFATFSFMDKDFKDKFKEAMGPDGPIVAARLEKLERQKIKVEALLQGYSFEDSAIEGFINGITDPAALFYPGMANPLESDTMLSGWNLDSMIASASNSDRVVSAFTTFLKEHKAQAEHNVMTDQKIKNLMAVVNQLLDAGFKLENLNDSISEWRTIEYTDPKTGERVQKRILDIAKPYSEEYESTYKNYSMRIKELNKEIYELKAEYYKEHKTTNEAVAKQNFLDKIAERDEFNNEYIEWLINNASLPYSDQFYELQLKLPNEIRDKLQKLYLEQEVILHDVGKGNEALLEPEDFDRLQELDTEIRRIRLDANEKNLDYAQYLEKLEQLYEYDLNEDAYKRAEKDALTRFSDDPERLNIWKKTNTVSRPTSEWYDMLTVLYEERAEIYGSDPEIKDLMDAKRKIMAPYKQNGRFNPKYLTEDEISELDKIESSIETIIEQNKKSAKDSPSSLSEEDQKRAREINDEIRRLVGPPQLNPIYVEEFDQRYKILKARYDEMIVADSNLNNLSTKAGSTEEDMDIAKSDWILAITAFGKEEQDFEYWYNNYHEDAYAKMSETQDHKDRRVPKNFNFERLPSSLLANKYMETVANPKYYKIKRLKIGNWTLDGVALNNKEIEELQKNPDEIERLLNAGRIITKPGAINPNFLKSPDGIPMPKEIIKTDDGNYGVNPKLPLTNNVNQKFKDLMSNPERFALYNALTTLFFDLQKKTEGRKIGYQVPGMAGSVMESFATLGLKDGFAKQYKAFMDKHLKVASQVDASENTYGDIGERIRMRFSNQLSEDIQSTDAIGSVLKWATEAHMNIAMQDVAPKSKSFITYLELQIEKLKEDSLKGDTYITNDKGERVVVDSAKKVSEIEKLVEILKYENKKFLYGITEDEQNRKLSKYVSSFFKYTSFIRIGFDVANQVKNYASGNVQAFLAAGNNSSDHYTQKDWLYAKGKVYAYDGFIANYFKDWGKVDDISDSTLLYRMINPAQKEIIKYYSDIAGGRKRKISEKATNVGDLGFLLQDKGDTEIAVTVMFAVMNHSKYELIESTDPVTGEKIFKRDAEGKIEMVAAHDAYYKDASGNLVIRPDVNYNKKEENRLRNIIYSEMRKAQGNYAKTDQTKFESKTMGKMVFFFRKFLVPQFLNRFGYMRPNWEGSEVALGYWRAVTKAYKYFGASNTLKEFFIGSNTLNKMGMSGGTRTYTIKDPQTKKVISEEEVGDFYAKRIHHARRDAIAMAFLTMLSMMLLAHVKRKDDDEEVGIIEGNLIRIIWGIKAETVSMFPVGEGSNEYVKNFTTAIPFIREATAGKNLISHGIKYGTAMLMNGGEEPDPGYDSEFYQEIWKDAFYTRKYGAFEKGDAKIMKDFMDLTGIKNFRDLVNPEYKIDVLKGKQ